ERGVCAAAGAVRAARPRRPPRGPGAPPAASRDRAALEGFPPVTDDHDRLFALRGAVQPEQNAAPAILGATEELMHELMGRNGLEPERIVSCIFTCTDDLDAEFPAVAARSLGLGSVPLLCTREIAVPGSMPRV